ncbi:MAG TPA: hypothetical protein VGW36_06430, partial [Pyrinomonadaceae bacterium]|nr:hypothetical protein [Pyrinomonadaceae bacterium]
VHMTDKKKGYLINMGPGEFYYFRVGIEPGMWKGKGKLTLEESEKSLKELKKIKFLGQDKIKDKNMVVEIAPPEPKPETKAEAKP